MDNAICGLSWAFLIIGLQLFMIVLRTSTSHEGTCLVSLAIDQDAPTLVFDEELPTTPYLGRAAAS